MIFKNIVVSFTERYDCWIALKLLVLVKEEWQWVL